MAAMERGGMGGRSPRPKTTLNVRKRRRGAKKNRRLGSQSSQGESKEERGPTPNKAEEVEKGFWGDARSAGSEAL